MPEVIFDFDYSKNKAVIKTDILDIIRENFSVKIKKFGSQRDNPYIPDRKYIITKAGYFSVGLYKIIIKYILNDIDVTTKIEFTENFKKRISNPNKNKNFNTIGLKTEYQLRDYQKECVEQSFKNGCGTILLGTGGGKSLILAYILINYLNDCVINNKKILVLVPDLGLVNKTFGDFIDYGISQNYMCKWTGKNPVDLSKLIIIANNAIVLSKFEENKQWISEDVGLLLYDEVHTCKLTNKINDVITSIKTYHKYGCTGTMPQDPVDEWNVIGQFGQVLYEKSSYELRQENYLTNCKILILRIVYNGYPEYDPSLDGNVNYEIELEWIKTQRFRNKVIKNLCKKFDNNALVLVDRIEHGEILKTLLLNNEELKHKEIFFVKGETDVAERDYIIKKMENNSNIICIAISKIFSTGINIKQLNYIVFASTGKAKTKIIQGIGRGLRLHETKKELTIIDMADDLKFNNKHLEERIKLYNSERLEYQYSKIYEKENTNN